LDYEEDKKTEEREKGYCRRIPAGLKDYEA
jgi:hypothetical protein